MTQEAFSDKFSAGALKRIVRLVILFSGLGMALSWLRFDWRTGVSFLLGASVAAINFQWLRVSVEKMVVGFLEQKKNRGIWFKLMGRYLLLAVVLYVIFKGYFLNVPAFVIGLLLPVLASMCEAAYEVYVALRHAE